MNSLQTIFISSISAVTCSVIISVVNFLLIRPLKRSQEQQDDEVKSLRAKVKNLEQGRVERLENDVKKGFESSYRGRKELHERINTEALRRDEFYSRMDDFSRSFTRLEKDIQNATAESRAASRDVAQLTGVLTQLSKNIALNGGKK